MNKLLVVLVVVTWSGVARADRVDLARAAMDACDAADKADVSYAAQLAAAERVVNEATRAQIEANSAAAKIKDAKQAADRVAEAQALVDAAKKDAATAQARVDAYNALCASTIRWSDYAGHDYPPQYIALKANLPGGLKAACQDLERIGTADVTSDLAAICGRSVTHETAASSFNNVAIDLVLGLGDHLEAQAKEETLEWVFEHIAKKFCSYNVVVVPGTTSAPATAIDLGSWFSQSCTVIFPQFPNKWDLDVDSFSFGALQVAFKEDLKNLPGKVTGVGKAWLDKYWPAGQYYIAVVGAIGFVGFEVWNHKSIPEILDTLDDKLEDTIGLDSTKQPIKCDFSTGTAPQRECFALLAFRLARTAADDTARNLSVGAIIQNTTEAFCSTHGPSGKDKDGSCVISAGNYEQWHTLLLEFYRAVKRFVDLNAKLLDDQEHYPHEAAAKSAVDYADALRGLFDAYTNIVKELPGGLTPGEADKLAQAQELVDAAFDAFDAVVGDDPAKLRTALGEVLASKVVGGHLSSSTAHVLTSIVALATAKDRTEVKGVLDDIMAPVGTYRMKHNPDHVIVAVNGFVGAFFGGELRMNVSKAAGASDKYDTGWAPTRLSAPVGIDVTFHTTQNIGVTFTLIDPLALAVSTKDDTVSADWKTLWEPGGYIRFGLGKSPFAVLIGGNYQPGRRSDEMCGTERCYDGAFQIGAYFTADVPLLVLH